MFTQRKNPRKSFFEASWTPDSRFVLSGGEDGSVHCWSAEAGAEVGRKSSSA
jgi:WD40 repeat protein